MASAGIAAEEVPTAAVDATAVDPTAVEDAAVFRAPSVRPGVADETAAAIAAAVAAAPTISHRRARTRRPSAASRSQLGERPVTASRGVMLSSDHHVNYWSTQSDLRKMSMRIF